MGSKLHLFIGIVLLIASFLVLSFSFTGFVIFGNAIKLNFIPAVLFLLAVVEIYLSIRVK